MFVAKPPPVMEELMDATWIVTVFVIADTLMEQLEPRSHVLARPWATAFDRRLALWLYTARWCTSEPRSASMPPARIREVTLLPPR